ncbi:MAG: Flp pilus assembly protein CpaB [Gemmataceae bacterium]
MRASTLFALTAAVLIGLGIAITLRLGGFFRGTAAEVRTAAPTQQVLVAARNLFAGDTIQANMVRVRALKSDEVATFKQHQGESYFLPAVPAAAALRMAKVNIEADTPITRDLLTEMKKPAPLNERLTPEMRAVNISLPKDRCAGGLIQVGEWVDVFLTSTIATDEGASTRTAAIGPKVRVIAKRDSLWPIFAPLPKDKPIEFTVEMSAYRAQLFEFARTKGYFSMTPLPVGEQKKLEAQRQDKLTAGKVGNNPPVAAGIESAPTDDDDEMRFAESTHENQAVTDHDLVLLFGIKRKESGPPPKQMVNIERYSGTHRLEPAVFTIDGLRVSPTSLSANNGANTHPTGVIGRTGRYTYFPHGSGGVTNDPRFRNGGLRVTGDSTGAGGFDNGAVRFSVPDCPSCKKNKY